MKLVGLAVSFVGFGTIGCASLGGSHSGKFSFEKLGSTVVLTPSVDARPECVLATGSPDILRALDKLEGKKISIRYEIGPAPVFVPTEIAGEMMYDTPALFRGVRISRYCRSQQIYWITAIKRDED